MSSPSSTTLLVSAKALLGDASPTVASALPASLAAVGAPASGSATFTSGEDTRASDDALASRIAPAPASAAIDPSGRAPPPPASRAADALASSSSIDAASSASSESSFCCAASSLHPASGERRHAARPQTRRALSTREGARRGLRRSQALARGLASGAAVGSSATARRRRARADVFDSSEDRSSWRMIRPRAHTSAFEGAWQLLSTGERGALANALTSRARPGDRVDVCRVRHARAVHQLRTADRERCRY